MRPEPSTLIALLPAGLFAAVIWSCSPNAPHHPEDRFPLEGKHEALPCEACHGTDGFEALPTDCASCHEVDRPPDHYPGDCGECHTAFGWLNFGSTTSTNANPHENNTFPLVGAHDLACGDCHTGPDYTGLDGACESCHEDVRPPYHYPGDCASCHPITTWADGAIHPVPLPHHTAACSSCHPDTADHTLFSCIDGCHLPEVTDPLHDLVAGYLRDSAKCAECHFPP